MIGCEEEEMSEKSLLDDMLADAKSAQDEELAEQGGSALAEARAKARRQGERKAIKSMASELDARRAAERQDEAGRIEADRRFREKAASAPPQMAGLEVGHRFELKGLDDQRDEGKGADRPSVTARVGPLGHQDVGTGPDSRLGMGRPTHQADN